MTRYLKETSPLLILLIFHSGLFLLSPHLIVDDGYISLQYARNFAEFNELSFNKNEWIYGFSNPLWVLLLGFLFKIFSNYEVIVVFLQALLFYFSSILLFKIALKFNKDRFIALLPALLFSSSFFIQFLIYSGLESVLLIFLICLAFYLQSFKALPAAFLIPLCRPDAILWNLGLILKEKRKIAFILVSLAGLVSLAIFGYLTYGSFMPQSAGAKVAPALMLSEFSGTYFIENIKFITKSFLGWHPVLGLPNVFVTLSLLLLFFKSQRLKFSVLLPLLVIFIVYTLAILSNSYRSVNHSWYYLSFGLLPILFLAHSTLRLNRYWFIGINLLIILSFGFSLKKMYFYQEYHYSYREQTYITLTSVISNNTSEEISIYTNEIGAIGYSCQDCKIYDANELISTENEKGLTAYEFVQKFEPDFIVFKSNFPVSQNNFTKLAYNQIEWMQLIIWYKGDLDEKQLIGKLDKAYPKNEIKPLLNVF